MRRWVIKKADRYQADALEENAAYQIFSLLSDPSFPTRLIHLTYNDTDGRLPKAYRESYGFLINPLDQLISRMDGALFAWLDSVIPVSGWSVSPDHQFLRKTGSVLRDVPVVALE